MKQQQQKNIAYANIRLGICVLTRASYVSIGRTGQLPFAMAVEMGGDCRDT